MLPGNIHSLLRRQMRRFLGDSTDLPQAIAPFLAAVNQAYHEADGNRLLNERALEISSRELGDANAELCYQKELFQGFMDNSPVLAYMQDALGRFSYANRQFQVMARRGWREIAGCTPDDLFRTEIRSGAVLGLIPDFSTGEPREVTETWPVDGPLHEFVVMKFRVRDARGTVHCASIGWDVTERRGIQEQLSQSQKLNAVGRLAGGIAHDFNNLLTVILGYAHSLEDRFGPEDPDRANVEEIVKAGDRAAELTRQLLVFSRKQTVALRRMQLNECIRETGRMLNRLIGDDIELLTRLQEDLWPVRADAGQMQQVVMNLALNARDAMPRGGKLTIESMNTTIDEAMRPRIGLPPGDYAMVAVSDTGSGITPEVRLRLFEPFFTTKEVGRGTGLGLATAYGIITQAKGHIAVYTEVGIGTTFKVYLPRAMDMVSPSPPPIAPSAPAEGRESILVVEDDPMIRRLILARLEPLGYIVSVARNGEEALEQFASRILQFDLILTDVVMPRVGGIELSRRIREHAPGMKTVFMSGYPDGALSHHVELPSGIPLLQKPFRTAELVRIIRETLDAPGLPGQELTKPSPGGSS